MILIAYFDESGTHDEAPVLAVAGYVATEMQWTRFDRFWGQFLNEEKIPYLHRVELVRPLQAAGVLAYEATTHLNKRLGLRHKNRDRAAATLPATVAHDNLGYWDRDNLAELSQRVQGEWPDVDCMFKQQETA